MPNLDLAAVMVGASFKARHSAADRITRSLREAIRTGTLAAILAAVEELLSADKRHNVS